MAQIKVSAKYWNSLNAAQQTALSDLAYKYGLQYAKRIISLISKHFPTFATIAPLSYYKPEIPDYLTNGVFIAMDGNGAILGTAQKSYGIGITERVKRHENGSYTEVWHN
jgi:hypothetical protein